MKKELTNKRLLSLDALRGFDMFWIIGGEYILHRLSETTNAPFWNSLSHQFKHPAWHGVTAYDLIFPLFLFLAGVATPYSIGNQLSRGKSKRSILFKVITRGLLLAVLGVVYNNGLTIKPIEEIRIGSVLGRIGLAYMFANIIYLYTKQRGQIVSIIGILIGYWALLLLGSAPGYSAGDLTLEGNVVSYIDTLIMPGYIPGHDPEGWVGTIPAIATALLGIFTGNRLKSVVKGEANRTALLIAGVGLSLVIVGQLWNFILPINKNLWTSSFVLFAGGVAMMLMSLFYYIIDIKGYHKWTLFFKVIGMNSILIYMSVLFIDWSYTTRSIFGWLESVVGSSPYSVIYICCFVLVKWGFLYFLYRKRVFLKV